VLDRIGSRRGFGDEAYGSLMLVKDLACRETLGGAIELSPAHRSRRPGPFVRQPQIRENPTQESGTSNNRGGSNSNVAFCFWNLLYPPKGRERLNAVNEALHSLAGAAAV